jgi:transcriptional regulator with XRE-family HTH domain
MPLRRPARPVRLRSPLGLFLAEARHSRGLTQADVAHALGVRPNFIARVETGEKTWPIARRAAWCALLDADQAELESVR